VGLTVLQLEVGNPAQPDVTIAVEFLVDSGAIYSVVPREILDRLDIRPLQEHAFRLADGTATRRKTGVAVFKYGDRIGGANVIFGEPGDSTLLGVLTLEALGYALDPLRRELRPLPMLLGAETLAR
jgi:clan AA aspartic protease